MFHISLRYSINVLNLLNEPLTHRCNQFALLFQAHVEHIPLASFTNYSIKLHIFHCVQFLEPKTRCMFLLLFFLFSFSIFLYLFCMFSHFLCQHLCEYISCFIFCHSSFLQLLLSFRKVLDIFLDWVFLRRSQLSQFRVILFELDFAFHGFFASSQCRYEPALLLALVREVNTLKSIFSGHGVAVLLFLLMHPNHPGRVH